MTFAYIVRCNFTAPDREQAWNDWYSGPKIVQMLRKPLFRSCQRFRKADGTGRDYLALWTLQSPDALKTPEYLSQWGFSEWTPLITDWSRDLFDGGDAPEQTFAVPPEGALHVVSFDGVGADDAKAASTAVAKALPDMMWLPIAGLDRHTPMMGLRVLAEAPLLPARGNERAQEAVYRPISEFHAAITSAA
jgi:hypothetical protein